MNQIKIFTDGSSRGNPGPGGWGVIVADNIDVDELGGREENTTNNRMELTACIEALKFFEIEYENEMERPITIYSDSSYVINGITKWVSGWQKNGWKTVAKGDVENRDLWEELHKLTLGKNTDWKHVKGHAGHGANERCDLIATSFADEEFINLYSGPLKEYSINLSTDHFPSSKLKDNSSKLKATRKAYSYLSLVDGVAMRHSEWVECEKRVKGVSGAKWKKTISKEDEGNILQDWGASL